MLPLFVFPFKKFCLVSLSLWERARGEGLADNHRTELPPSRTGEKENCLLDPVSPHPNPLPKGEGVRIVNRLYFNCSRPLTDRLRPPQCCEILLKLSVPGQS